MSERRYSEEEVQAIFAEAAEADDPRRTALAAAQGPTLGEIVEIGAEVGLDQAAIRAAAARLDALPSASPRRQILGMPVGVSRTVDLPRAPTDQEWQILVAEARRTFAAKGATESSGDLRAWSNGNLHVLVEPTATGYQLRMRSLKSSAVPMNMLSGGAASMAALISTIFWLDGAPAAGYVMAAFFVVVAVVALLTNVVGLPRWADEREEQFEELGRMMTELLGE